MLVRFVIIDQSSDKMPKFYNLQVAEINRETKDCALVTFLMPEELKKTFQYTQGQYLTLSTEINGEQVRRSYSLCSSPLDDEWQVGIKKVEGGKFSTFVNETLQIGDTIQAMPADGKFFVTCETEKQRNFAAFAAGSGITPIVSIIKTHLAVEPKSTFKLFYVNQSVSSIMLKEELEELKDLYMGRLEIFHFLTREKRSIPFLNGRIDKEKLDIIFKSICNKDEIDHYFLCGPEEMIELINGYLQNAKVGKEKIHFELFGTNYKKTEAKRKSIAKTFEGKQCDLTIIEGGISINFMVEQGKENILDAALNNAADLPFACKGGVCATCKAKVIEGEVDMLLSYGLEEEEKEAGYILTCQSLPTSDKLVVDFDI